MQKRKIKFFTQSTKGRERKNWELCTSHLSFISVGLPVRPLVWHILGVIIVSLSGISGWPPTPGNTTSTQAVWQPSQLRILTRSPPLSLFPSLYASHSARFSYNNILIPLIHATLAAKPNKLKAAARARRLRGLLNVACCCWTLPAFRRAHFLGFSHLLTPSSRLLPGIHGWVRVCLGFACVRKSLIISSAYLLYSALVDSF